MTWIDSHVHVWTQDTARYPAPGFDVSTLEPKEFTAEWLLRHCRPFDVSRIVLVQAIYGVDNSYMLDTAARYPGVFGIVASVDHNDGGVAATMAELKARGVMGFRIAAQPGKGEGWLDHPGYKAMFETARQTGQAICPLTHPAGVPDLDRMCGEHPDTTVVVDHMSRIGELNPIDDDEIDRLCALARHPKGQRKGLPAPRTRRQEAAARRPGISDDRAGDRGIWARPRDVGQRLPVPGGDRELLRLRKARARPPEPLRCRPPEHHARHGGPGSFSGRNSGGGRVPDRASGPCTRSAYSEPYRQCAAPSTRVCGARASALLL